VQAALLNCYLSTLEMIAESMVMLCPEIAQPFKEKLARWPRRLLCDTTAKTLEESRISVRSDLRDFSEAASPHLRGASQTAVLTDLALASFSRLQEQTEAHCKLTDAVCEQIQEGADLDDANRFRSMLQQQLTGLRANAGRMQQGIAKLLEHITNEPAFQPRAQAAGSESPGCEDVGLDGGDRLALATTSTLQGLLSRASATRRLHDHAKTDEASFTLVFKVEHYAEAPVEQIKASMARLAGQVQEAMHPTDFASRWSEDRMLVFFREESEETEQRVSEMARAMSDRFFLDSSHTQDSTPSVKIVYWKSPRLDVWELIERVDSV